MKYEYCVDQIWSVSVRLSVNRLFEPITSRRKNANYYNIGRTKFQHFLTWYSIYAFANFWFKESSVEQKLEKVVPKEFFKSLNLL